MRPAQTLLSLFATLPFLAAQQSEPQSKPAEPAASDLFGPGWRWELKPTDLQLSFDPQGETRRRVWTEHGQNAFTASGYLLLIQSAVGRPIVCHVRTKNLDLLGTDAPEFRPVLLADDGSHLASMMSMSQRRNDMHETRYVFTPPKDPERIVKLALAILDLDGKQERARLGAERARKLGATVLPLPRLGEKFAFELETLDGERIQSQALLGQVVLIDCWATW